jgi:chitinase
MPPTTDHSVHAEVDGDLDDAAPAERLSWFRLAFVVLVAAVGTTGVVAGVRAASSDEPPERHSWSIPYVDVTLTPTYEFQNPRANPARDIALAFVVSDPEAPCEPSWGGSYSMEAAGEALELDRRITQLRGAGGDIIVSFGGQANSELAYACEDLAALTDAYRAVVERYDVRAIDLDIENEELADQASIARRATAIATVQRERAAFADELAVWLTLPVATSGLTADGVALVEATLEGGVQLAGVNVMTMNFGDAAHPTADMLGATVSALRATADQLAGVYRDRGVTLDEAGRWALLGATPMIGQNDVDGEVFTLDDARGLSDFATERGLGRVSIWSLNRDAECDATFADVMVHSNTCSSVAQDALAFANVFSALTGRAGYLPAAEAVTVPDRPLVVDDPSTSPYPVWRPDAEYPEGYKVVRGGKVYQSKWYTQGDDPAAVVANAWESPWTMVGPVQPDDEPFVPQTVAPGTYPEWEHGEAYAPGDRVLLDGLPYEARWPIQGEAPSTLFPVGPSSAWTPLFEIAGEPVAP